MRCFFDIQMMSIDLQFTHSKFHIAINELTLIMTVRTYPKGQSNWTVSESNTRLVNCYN